MIFPLPQAHGNLKACVTVSGNELRGFLAKSGAGPHAKLVFISDSALYYVDFSEALNDTPSIRILKNCGEANAPVISPSGKLVAFASSSWPNTYDPASELSPLWVSELQEEATVTLLARRGCAPRFVQNTSNATVVYATCSAQEIDSEYAWNGCGMTVTKTIIGGIPQSKQTVYGGGSYWGGLSWDERYLATCEFSRNAFILDLGHPDNGPLVLHRHAKNTARDADSLFSVQTCYPSISSSRIFTDAMMYIDFGGTVFFDTDSLKHPVLGTPWGKHERIFIERATCGIVGRYDVPGKDEIIGIDSIPEEDINGIVRGKAWWYPRWSNHPYFAVSSLDIDRLWYRYSFQNALWYQHTNNRESLWLINLKDST